MSTSSESAHSFAAHERPTFPGSPFTPEHPGARRLAYAGVAFVCGVCSTLGNGLINVNVAALSGSMDWYVFETSLLPAIYVAANATANLMLVKARTQLGIPAVTRGLLVAYALAALLQFVWPSMAMAILIRATCGMAAAGLITFAIYNWMQVFPARLRPLALVLGISLPQLGLPLARLFPVEMLALADWRAIHLIELGIALLTLSLGALLPLPPSERSRAFEPLDFATFALALTGMTALCLVLAEGRLLWWTDTPWLGWALALAVLSLTCAATIESRRTKPLLQVPWLGSLTIIRFALVALLVRVTLAEQTYGAVGLLTLGGLNNDQLRLLFALVAGAMLSGAIVAVLTLSEKRLPYQVMMAALIIAFGAWLDTDATSWTRPPQLYLSQSLLAFGTTLFVGPALLYGFLKMFQRGADHLVSFVVLFSVTQNVGGLIGSALLGSYQTIAAREHSAALAEHLLGADPQVAARLQAGAAALSGAIAEGASRATQGASLLMQALTREANVLAYNDVFRWVMTLALLTAAYIAYILIFNAVRRR